MIKYLSLNLVQASKNIQEILLKDIPCDALLFTLIDDFTLENGLLDVFMSLMKFC